VSTTSKPRVKRSNSKSSTETVEFIVGSRPLRAGETRAQFASVTDIIKRPLDEVKAEWEAVFLKIQDLSASADRVQKPGGLRLDSISVALGFTAKGKLAFIAEAGIQATVTVTLKRP
jgi:hypothetical protein